MKPQKVSLDIEKQVEALFKDLRSGISAREDSRAFGAMIERRITENWERVCRELIDPAHKYYTFGTICGSC